MREKPNTGQIKVVLYATGRKDRNAEAVVHAPYLNFGECQPVLLVDQMAHSVYDTKDYRESPCQDVTFVDLWKALLTMQRHKYVA